MRRLFPVQDEGKKRVEGISWMLRFRAVYARLTEPSSDRSERLFIWTMLFEMVYSTFPMYSVLVMKRLLSCHVGSWPFCSCVIPPLKMIPLSGVMLKTYAPCQIGWYPYQ